MGRLAFSSCCLVLSILPQAKHLTTSCMVLTNAYLMMYFCTLLSPCTPQINTLNYNFTASKPSTTLYGKNLRLHGRRCYGNNTLRRPQSLLLSVDSVMKRAPDRACKLSPKFTGPFLLTTKLHANKFKIPDPSNNTSEVVQSRIKVASPPQALFPLNSCEGWSWD